MSGRISIRQSPLVELSSREAEQLHGLTIQNYSSELRSVLDRKYSEDIVWIARRENSFATIVGWCSLYRPFRQPFGYEFIKIGVYVDPAYRDHGIGSRLVHAADDVIAACLKPVHAVPTSEQGRAFFRKFENIKLGPPK